VPQRELEVVDFDLGAAGVAGVCVGFVTRFDDEAVVLFPA
jgi:hypothetical protein